MTGKAYRVDSQTDAVIVVDVQVDFCPGGALAVPEGDRVVPVLNEWLAIAGLFKVATRDWHPADHCSFREQGGPWPSHCVKDTAGARFHPRLKVAAVDLVISKAVDHGREELSGFARPELPAALRGRGVQRLWVGGLATEYCVKETCLDARRLGFDVVVIEDAVRGVEVKAGDCARARQELAAAGVAFVASGAVVRR